MISCPVSDVPIQGTAPQSVHSTLGVHCSGKGGETDGHTQGYKNPPVPRRLVGESQVTPSLSPAYLRAGENVSRPRLVGKFREIRTGTQTGFRIYQFDLRSGRWQILQAKIQTLLSLPACPVRKFMSLIGLLTATEKFT